MKDLYNILGLQKDASEKDIKNAFRKLSLKYHPDKQNGKTEAEKKEAEERFKEVAEAYNILSNKEKRQQYDMYGEVGGNFSGSSDFNPNDIFEQFVKMHMGGFTKMNMNDFEHTTQQNIPSIQLRVNLTLKEVYMGGNKKLKYEANRKCNTCNGTGSKNGSNSKKICPHCQGSGYIMQTKRYGNAVISNSTICPNCHGTGWILTNPCPHCGGNGYERKFVEYDLELPNGIVDGSVYRISNEGNYIPNTDNSHTDLNVLFNISLEQDYEFSRTNPYDIIYNKDLPLLDCLTGGKIEFTYIDGKKYTVNISACTHDNSFYEMKNMGLIMSNGVRGSLFIRIKHKLPKTLSSEDIKLIEKLKKSKNFK